MFKNLSVAALGVSANQSEIIELALTYGFQGLEVDIVEFAASARLRGIAHARRLIESAKLRVGSFALPVELDADEAVFNKGVQKLAECAPVAAQLGCTRCVTSIAPASATRPYHENFEFHRRRISDLAGLLTPHGIRLGVGFRAGEYLRKGAAFQFIHDLDALLLLVNMIPGTNVGVVLDAWDLHVSGVPLDRVRTLKAAQVVAVDVANLAGQVAPADVDAQSRLLPGIDEGAIDLVAFLGAVAELGYDGPVTVRPARTALKSTRRDLAIRETGESLAKVWKAAGLAAGGRPVPAAS